MASSVVSVSVSRMLCVCVCVQAWDLAIGAAAGVASVLVSMPLDVIKTYLQTHGAEIAVAPGMAGQVAAFWQTGG